MLDKRQVPPFAKRKGGLGGMLWQVFHKQLPSNRLPAIRLHAGHPPLTLLRSFAPPYASRRVLVALRPRNSLSLCVRPCHSGRVVWRGARGVAVRCVWRTPPRTGAATRACPYGCIVVRQSGQIYTCNLSLDSYRIME